MSKVHFRVRPRDSRDGWVVDRYDGRGSWTMTDGLAHHWTIAEARKAAGEHTRRAVNSKFNKPAVNKAQQCEYRIAKGHRCGHRAAGGGKFCGIHGRGTLGGPVYFNAALPGQGELPAQQERDLRGLGLAPARCQTWRIANTVREQCIEKSDHRGQCLFRPDTAPVWEDA